MRTVEFTYALFYNKIPKMYVAMSHACVVKSTYSLCNLLAYYAAITFRVALSASNVVRQYNSAPRNPFFYENSTTNIRFAIGYHCPIVQESTSRRNKPDQCLVDRTVDPEARVFCIIRSRWLVLLGVGYRFLLEDGRW
jgi:hypothetical protein